MNSSARITGMLIDWSNGDSRALDELVPAVESELRLIARNFARKFRPGVMMQTTALINEAYIRLVDQKRVNWQNRAHFYAIAASMMRRVLLNRVRDQNRQKRGGGAVHLPLDAVGFVPPGRSRELIALDEALCELQTIDERKAKVVELRFFGGLSVVETAEVLGVSKVTVCRDWEFARAWLAREINDGS